MGYRRATRDTYNYTLTGRHGEDLYHGITNDPERREAQHRASGRRFANLVSDPYLLLKRNSTSKRKRQNRNIQEKSGSKTQI
jgi:predicted GIY-YIG superfamily endonuclease